ncbi:hypothetical protein WAF17_16875 [Bernardetia sp. ABR2-2B]|uniref:hypothetical protein n=1 Tax=Bernardetia sp. ABR2-2B TaxID=3127472 RepID=UPI0030CBBBCD
MKNTNAMKETTTYPIYLFKEPILIPKMQEEKEELIFKIEDFLIKHKTLRREKSKIYHVCLEYFQDSIKLNLDVDFQLYFSEKHIILVEFIFDDIESKFVKQLRKYSQIFKDKGFSVFKTLYRNAVKNKNHSVEDKVIMMLYAHLRNNQYIFKEEITKDNKFKITYQIGNQA